jgi:hypothetical protein
MKKKKKKKEFNKALSKLYGYKNGIGVSHTVGPAMKDVPESIIALQPPSQKPEISMKLFIRKQTNFEYKAFCQYSL